ncbi:MAG: L,D-transpeptidase [Rhizobiaceae bacterium]|jgi:lipoprotein-anchoring transpeptidase ErfK/SrfK|nr:L,D-transpeptidase [Rhizobiaceae bacterium]
MIKRAFLATALALAGFSGAPGSIISAAAYEEGQVWDLASRSWIDPRPRGQMRSNKSPIKRKMISFEEDVAPGTIVIDTSDRRLYHVVKPGKAMAYGIGVGREGFTWTGRKSVTRKAEWPGWTPPAVMRARVLREEGRKLPAFMPGGPENPLGARALYLGSSIYRIHGTNQPWTIGQAVSSGCFRMANDDVTHLYEQVAVGAKVIIRE